MKSIQPQYALRSRLEWICSTSTILLQITLKYTGLQWVRYLVIFHRRGFIDFLVIVLHPTHKLKYFSKQGWDKEWIKTAEDIVREEFKQNYAEYVNHNGKTLNASQPSKKVFYIARLSYNYLL